MDGTTVVSLGVGVVVPAAVSFLKNVHWDRKVRILVGLVVSLVAATLALVAQGALHSWTDLVSQAAVVWASATANYHLWFQGTDVNLTLENMGVGAGNAAV